MWIFIYIYILLLNEFLIFPGLPKYLPNRKCVHELDGDTAQVLPGSLVQHPWVCRAVFGWWWHQYLQAVLWLLGYLVIVFNWCLLVESVIGFKTRTLNNDLKLPKYLPQQLCWVPCGWKMLAKDESMKAYCKLAKLAVEAGEMLWPARPKHHVTLLPNYVIIF